MTIIDTPTTMRTAAGPTPDEDLQRQVEQAIHGSNLESGPVRVEVLDGVVVLCGEVDRVPAAKGVLRAVLAVAGVVAVADELTIRGFAVRPRNVSTRDAAARVQRVLHGWHGDHGSVAVEVNGTVATLTGSACSSDARQEAVRAAWSSPHVSIVQCRIRIPRRSARPSGRAADEASPGGDALRAYSVEVSSSVLFIAELERSITFYRDLLGCEVTIRDTGAALLLTQGGFQLYLVERGLRAEHALHSIGSGGLIWSTRTPAELHSVATALTEAGSAVYEHTDGGVHFVESHDPDGLRVVVTQPAPDALARTTIASRLYT